MLRFAPSPTGDMNIGNLRVAIFNYIMSKQLNEDLIINGVFLSNLSISLTHKSIVQYQ